MWHHLRVKHRLSGSIRFLVKKYCYNKEKIDQTQMILLFVLCLKTQLISLIRCFCKFTVSKYKPLVFSVKELNLLKKKLVKTMYLVFRAFLYLCVKLF